jgi:methionyl-tRNA formyltransferase
VKRLAVIGNGKMAVDCLKIIKNTAGLEVALVVTEPRTISPGNTVQAYATKENLAFIESEKINAPAVVEALQAAAPDVILNINSFQIIRPAILDIPREGVINFHNGPLPKYGGVNVCSWAIINGETRHGVSWHYVDQGIDTGSIVAQRMFDLSPAETAVSLIMKCISEGTALFRDWLPRLVDGGLVGQKQDASKATYFSRKDLPNGGMLNFAWGFAEFDRFVRGLSFHPIPNTFLHAGARFGGRRLFVQSVQRLDPGTGAAEGTVVGIRPEYVAVQIGDGTVGLSDILDDNKDPIAVDEFVRNYGVAVGAKFTG